MIDDNTLVAFGDQARGHFQTFGLVDEDLLFWGKRLQLTGIKIIKCVFNFLAITPQA